MVLPYFHQVSTLLKGFDDCQLLLAANPSSQLLLFRSYSPIFLSSRSLLLKMLTPAVANYVTQFYPIGNTPAVSLTRGLPQGVDADILLLGCGDIRNVLFTAYANKGFRKLWYSCISHLDHRSLTCLASRKLDITCCDYETAIIGTQTRS